MCRFPRSIWFCGVALAGLVPAVRPSPAADEAAAVSLILTEASAHHDGDGDTTFTCKLTIDNATGDELVVKSRFNSAMDGLDIVVTDVDGKVLAQQGYTYHQSPRRELQEFVLMKGESQETIVFPLSDFGPVGRRLKVRLAGFLPYSSYGSTLSTETKEITVQGPATKQR